MKLFKQVRKLMIDKILIDFDKLDFEFNVQCSDDNKSDIATFTIYNLSETTKKALKKGQVVSLTAGYEELQGVIFNGVVEEVLHKRLDNDIATIIYATPNNYLYTNTIVNKQFKAGITARDILSLLSKEIPFKIDVKGLGKNTNYPNGKAFSNRLSNVIDVIAKDTNSRARLTNNTIEFTEKDKVYSSIIKLNATNGLVRCEKQDSKKDEKNEKKQEKEKYNLECLLIPIIQINQLLEIESYEYTGKLKVKELTYNATDINTFSVVATCEVVK
ncbi:MAG: hypothetical protein SOY60_06980 [Fusobacterium gastrosuis]|uniref:hypothetical protein n=1 Tax=Fusobacterium gastrosuis TaxID=1755100 RepID=UPI002A869786|nr:hypothetical protein [Fusobacterium gastrosuis]